MPAIFDTSSALIYTPYSLGNKFAEQALLNVPYQDLDGVFTLACDTDVSLLRNVGLLMNGYWVEITPESYFL